MLFFLLFFFLSFKSEGAVRAVKIEHIEVFLRSMNKRSTCFALTARSFEIELEYQKKIGIHVTSLKNYWTKRVKANNISIVYVKGQQQNREK